MINKVIIILLAILLILSGAMGTYSYFLNTEIDSVLEQLTQLREESTIGLAVLSSKQETYSQETGVELGIIGRKVEDNLEASQASGEVIQQNSSRLNKLKGEIGDVVRGLAEDRSRLVAYRIYEAVIQSVIRVSDGRNTIGSGFVYDTQGHIITAHHVIEQLDDIFVIFPDGRVSRASVVGSSSQSDVAVLLLESQVNVLPVVMANSESINIGEAVITIGSPLEQSDTVTAGIVSQLNRLELIGSDSGSRLISNLIQFDAPANFGNSGGPLFNVDGEVIGLIIARVEPVTGEGISYAVSANKVIRVADTIIEQGFYEYPWFGIEASNLTPEQTEELNRSTIHGALVSKTFPSSPAEQAGIEVDDIIVNIDDRPIEGMGDLTSYLGEYTSPGDSIEVTVDRSGNLLQLTVILGVR